MTCYVTFAHAILALFFSPPNFCMHNIHRWQLATATTPHNSVLLVVTIFQSATMEQPEGSYPRINGELMGTGVYDDMIVSMIGRFDTTRTNVAAEFIYTNFICCDHKVIELVTEHAAALPPEVMTVAKEMVFELIGQVQAQSNKLVVRCHFPNGCSLGFGQRTWCH